MQSVRLLPSWRCSKTKCCHHHLPPPPSPYAFSPSPSFISSPTPELPDVFPSTPGPSWVSGFQSGPLSPPRPSLPPGPRPHLPPPSPSCQNLRALEEVMDQQGDWVRVGRVAIKLAKEHVFGSDVMATGKLSEEGLHFIRLTLR